MPDPKICSCQDCAIEFVCHGQWAKRCPRCREIAKNGPRTHGPTVRYLDAVALAGGPVPLTCVGCGSAFERRGDRGPIPDRCDACRAVAARAYFAARNRRILSDASHPSHAKMRGWRRVRGLRVYGLTPAEYDRLSSAQGGRCAVCRQSETQRDRAGRVKPLAVDHDHATDTVRGLLCHACNVAIGYLDDDPDRADAAAVYLRASARRRLRLVESAG